MSRLFSQKFQHGGACGGLINGGAVAVTLGLAAVGGRVVVLGLVVLGFGFSFGAEAGEEAPLQRAACFSDDFANRGVRVKRAGHVSRLLGQGSPFEK